MNILDFSLRIQRTEGLVFIVYSPNMRKLIGEVYGVMDGKGAWQAVLGQLQLEMAKATFDTWVRDAVFVAFEDGSYIIGVKNAYARDWLESRLTSTITRLLVGLMDRTVEVRFIVWQEQTRAEPQPVPDVEIVSEEMFPQQQAKPDRVRMNPRYSFEFLRGRCWEPVGPGCFDGGS